MNYKKATLITLLIISILSSVTLLTKYNNLNKVNLKLTDISGNRAELTESINGVIEMSLGKKSDITINNKDITISKLQDFDSIIGLGKEKINKNKEYYANYKRDNGRRVIIDENNELLSKVSNGNIEISAIEEGDYKKYTIPLLEEELNYFNDSNVFIYVEPLKRDGDNAYFIMGFTNWSEGLRKSFVTVNLIEKKYVIYDLDYLDGLSGYLLSSDNKLYGYNYESLFLIDFKNNKYENILKYYQLLNESRFYNYPSDSDYIYFFTNDKDGVYNIKGFNLLNGTMISCSNSISQEDYNNIYSNGSVKLWKVKDKIYKIYEDYNEPLYASDYPDRSFLIDVFDLSKQENVYRGQLNLNNKSMIELDIK